MFALNSTKVKQTLRHKKKFVIRLFDVEERKIREMFIFCFFLIK